jgi:methylated-DNA-protein-cysteine methyltransferase-like protein
MPSFYHAVWNLVRQIPEGKVASYGQIATWLGTPRAARAVGYAMFNVQDGSVPWHRVINAKGEISIGGALHRPELQHALLLAEGVRFDSSGRIDWRQHGWRGPKKLRSLAMPMRQHVTRIKTPRLRH